VDTHDEWDEKKEWRDQEEWRPSRLKRLPNIKPKDPEKFAFLGPKKNREFRDHQPPDGHTKIAGGYSRDTRDPKHS
jgi:hypothetical protein